MTSPANAPYIIVSYADNDCALYVHGANSYDDAVVVRGKELSHKRKPCRIYVPVSTEVESPEAVPEKQGIHERLCYLEGLAAGMSSRLDAAEGRVNNIGSHLEAISNALRGFQFVRTGRK